MIEPQPLVSIGLPVYQGENFLREALDALLAQTMGDFEIIISDNASTDETGVICNEYAARDSRIRYLRQPENVGAVRNYNIVFDLSGGEYFKWAAHDDVCMPRFLESCLDALTASPESVLAYSLHETVDASGRVITGGGNAPDLALASAATRVDAVLNDKAIGNPPLAVFGLIRRNALARTRLHGAYTGSDRTLMTELALLGSFLQIDEVLFRSRDHPDRSIRVPKGRRLFHRREVWFAPEHAGKIVLPNWRRLQQLFTAVARAPLPLPERAKCLGVLTKWVVRGNWKRLLHDLGLAVMMVVRPDLRPR